jgi:PAS domain S-box-containing protein
LQGADLLETFLENAPDGIYVSDMEGNFLYGNRRSEEITGYSREELIGRSFLDLNLLSDRSLKKAMELLQASVEGKATGPDELELIDREGHSVPVEISTSVVTRGGQRIVLGFVRDISERKRAEEAMQENERKFRTLFDAANDSIFIMKDYRFVYCNRKTLDMFRCNEEDIINHSPNDFSPEVQPDGLRSLEKSIDKMRMAVKDRPQFFEWKHLRMDGAPFDTEVSLNSLELGGDTYILATVRDITDRKRSDEALKKSEERYHRLFDLGSDAIFLVDNETGRILEANKASSYLYGYSREELLRRTIADLSAEPEQTRDVIRKELTMVPLRYQKKKDGTIFPVEITITHMMWNGKRSHLSAIRDITQRKRAEEELERQRSHLRLVIDTVPNYIFAKDIDGTFLLANRAVAEVFGVDTGDVVGKTDLDYGASEEQKAAYNMADRAVIASGKPLLIPEEQIMRKDGTLGWFQTTKIPYHHPGHDKPAILGVSVEITDRKLAEEQIRREREKLQILSDNAPFGLVLINRDGRFNYINNRFTQLFGYDLSDVPDGKTWFRKAFPHAKHRYAAISNWMDNFRNATPGERTARIFKITCKDGTQRVVQFIPSMLVTGDYLMTCEDITELRRLESHLRRAQKMEAIGTLAGGIAHDFNNILTALMGYASLMQIKMDEGNPLGQYVDQIFSAVRKATDLTQGLLTFSRQKPVTLVPTDMNEAIRTTEQLLKRLLTEDIELRASLTKDHTVVMADKSQMDQVLFNLVTNARDAMPRGGKIGIETEILDMDGRFVETHGFGAPGKYVALSISDTGEGMDEATRGKIFDPFFTTKEVGKGTGLGLATVYGVIKQHNGYITVYSEPKRGTTFHIYLPALTTEADVDQEPASPVTGGDETILIAEDDENVRHIMGDVLREWGYKTIEATDGEEAIERFKLYCGIDLVVVDSVMPRKNGREVYEELRRIDPRIKVLFTSGYTRDVVLDKGIEDKKLDFIAKPLSLNGFLRKIREVLDR